MKIWIPFTLPSMNDIIAADRASKYAGAAMKKRYTDMLAVIIETSDEYRQIRGPVSVRFYWIERDHRRDPDNISSGGRKFILDALVLSGAIQNDSQKYIKGLQDIEFTVSKTGQGVRVYVDELREVRGFVLQSSQQMRENGVEYIKGIGQR